MNSPSLSRNLRLRTLLAFLFLAACSAYGKPQAPTLDLENYNGCGMEGDTSSPAVRALNRMKNRYTAPTPEQINHAVTLAAMLVPGNDTGAASRRNGKLGGRPTKKQRTS